MDVLGVILPDPLAAFYAEVERQLAGEGITLTCEARPGPEFGGFYLEDDRAVVGLRHDLPPDAILHTLAHELVHGLQRREGWPRAVANPELGEQSDAEEVASVLQAIVHCAGAELRIAPLGLDPSWEHRERHKNVRQMLRAPHPGASQPGTPAWAYWSLLYAYISLIHAPERSRTLLHNFERAVPEAATAGRRAVALVRERGVATREQALAALRAVQESLALAPHILIEDLRDGAVYGAAAQGLGHEP